MTRLLTCGYETGDVAEAGTSTISSTNTITVVSATPTPRAGSYCVKMAVTSGALDHTFKTYSLGAAKTEVWLRFAFYVHGGTAGTTEMELVHFNDSAAAVQASVGYNFTDNLLRAYRGALPTNLLGTASTAFPQDTWHVIEVRWQATSTTVGIMEVWLDGNRVINVTAVDTTNTGNVNVQTVQLGASNTMSGSTAVYAAFDDIAINDTAGTINNARAGDGRVVLLTPNGAGSSTQWVRGGTDTGANYSQVSELPPSIAQYVSSPTVANRDLYTMSDLGVAVNSINCVEAIALAQNSDAGGGSIGLTLKSGATINEATAIGLSTSAGYVGSRWETDPNTAAAWTIAAVNALEAGATVR